MKDEKTEYKQRTGEVKVRQNVEWGRLRTCLLGTAGPTILPPITPNTASVYEGNPVLRESLEKHGGKNAYMEDAWRAQHDLTVKTHEDLTNVLEKLGVEVLRYQHAPVYEKYLGWTEAGYYPATVEDTYKVIGDTLLEVAPGSLITATVPLPFGFRDYIHKFMEEDKGFHWLSMPPFVPDPDKQGPGPFVSAAEMRVLPNKTVVIGLGVHDWDDAGKPGTEYTAVNHLGVEILNRMYEPYGWRFEAYYYLSKYCHHSNGEWGPIREGLMVASPAVSLDKLPPSLKDWEVIVLSHEEALLGAANVLPIDSKTTVVSANCPKMTEALVARGVEPHPVDFAGTSIITAGAQCNVAAINRDDV